MINRFHNPFPVLASRGHWLLVVAAVMWSTTGLFVKAGPLRDIPGPTLACLRAFFAAACLLPLVRRSDIRFRPGLVPMAGSFAAMNVLFLTAMTMTTAAAAVFLQYTAIPWTFLLGLLVLKESWHRGSLVTVGLAVAGIACIVTGSGGNQTAWGNLLAVASGLTFAGVIVSLRRLRDESPVFLILVNQSASCLVLLPWLYLHPPVLSIQQWLLLAAFGVFQMSIPYLLFARGLKSARAQDASLIALLEPVLTPVWVWLVGWETAAAWTWLGGGLILSGLVLRYTVWSAPGDGEPTNGGSADPSRDPLNR
ncbi:MAG: EamA family transporter [Planctomycetaceae bacterium]|jgi:drug/metabolite transporter (DMT)-like permease|nr:EamA family transporter [Planctomycetaceae bacterium]